MADNAFFNKLYKFFMRRDGTVIGIYYMTPDGNRIIDGMFVACITASRTRQIIFDPEKWESNNAMAGVQDAKFEAFDDVRTIWLGPSISGNGEDLPDLCRNALLPKGGSGFMWPVRLIPKFDLWIRADCPD